VAGVKKGDTVLPTQQAWREFIAESKIDVELTMFSIGNKRHHFLRIGSFNTINQLPKTPVFYWRDRVASPKLCINKLTRIFTLNIGRLNLTYDDECSHISESDESSSDESESELSQDFFSEVNTTTTTSVELNLPDPSKFPLLHSLSYNLRNMDRLMQEILLVHGNKQITSTRGNLKGSLILLPLHRHLDRFEAELSKQISYRYND
jgi:hypothetical protein